MDRVRIVKDGAQLYGTQRSRIRSLILQHERFVFETVELVRQDKKAEKGRDRYRDSESVAERLRAQLQGGEGEQQISQEKARGNDQYLAARVEIKQHVEYRHQQHLHADGDNIDVEQMDV